MFQVGQGTTRYLVGVLCSLRKYATDRLVIGEMGDIKLFASQGSVPS